MSARDTRTLPAYTENGRCAKCGCPDVSVLYCRQPRPGEECWRALDSTFGEHFHRTCRRCHYEWLEAVCGTSELAERLERQGLMISG